MNVTFVGAGLILVLVASCSSIDSMREPVSLEHGAWMGLRRIGMKEGLWIFELDSHPPFITKYESYTKGVLNGPVAWLNFKGTVMMYTFFQNGKELGSMIGLDPNGQVKWVRKADGTLVGY